MPAATRKIAPTLVLDPTDAMLCMQEELFGPVLPIVGYGQLDDAIRFVNERPRPLALYYFGHARANVERVLAETVSGGVTINETLLHILQDDLPFGGVGPSGMGAYHGRDGFEAFSHKKAVYRQSRISTGVCCSRPSARPPTGCSGSWSDDDDDDDERTSGDRRRRRAQRARRGPAPRPRRLRVLVLEDKATVGGACKTERPFAKAPEPGHVDRARTCSG